MNTQGMPMVGLAGYGYWGRNIARNFFELGALGAVCDPDESRLREASQKFGVPVESNFGRMLARPEIQAIAIAAPAARHFELARKAILAGKDVLVEKPLALRHDEGQELTELASKHSRILMVGHLLQYHPAIIELRRLLQEGELGRIEYISSSRLNLGKLRTEENILWSFAPHDISAILYLLDETPSSVSAQGVSYLNPRVTDITLTVMSFASGMSAHIFVSWLHPFKEQKLVVIGNRRMAVFDDTEEERKLTLFPHRIDWVNRMPVARKAEGEVVPLPKVEPLNAECLHFLECVRDRRQPRTDGENGVRVLRILESAGESVRANGKSVSIAPEAQNSTAFYAHPSALVDSPCEIGEGTKIWHFSHVMENCRIGSHCNLGQNVHVAPRVRIGNGVKIQNNVSLYTGVELEDDVFCGPSMVFTNVVTPRSHVNRKSEYRPTLVKRGATLGANCTIVCGVTIGRYAFVGAGAVVTRDVADYALVVGVPARQIGWVCRCGARLDDSRACVGCGTHYQVLNNSLHEVGETRMDDVKLHRAMAAGVGQV